MDTIIGNTVVITVDEDRRILEDGAVAVQGDSIVAVGPTREVRAAYPTLPVIDGAGKAVLPGFINTHTHTGLMVLRSTVEDMDIPAGSVYGYMSPITFAMTPEERSAVAAVAGLEAIRSGTTTLVDPLRHVATYAQALADSGLRLYLSESCADALTLEVRHGAYTYDRQWGQDFLDRATELVERFHGADNGRVQVQIAAHAPDNCSPWMLDELREMAVRHGLRRTVHLAQSPAEVVQVAAAHGRTPAEYLDDHGWLGDDLIAAHWTNCTESDVKLLATRGVHMAHCPASGSRRRPQPSPVGLIREAGVNMTLGTDNMSENMFSALSFGIGLHRGALGGTSKPTPNDMLDAATRNGALAVGRAADLGSIEPGKKADLTVIDLEHPTMSPMTSIVGNIVHYGHPGIVDSVMVGGRFVLEGGRITTLDEKAVVREAQRATQSAWRRLLDGNADLQAPPGFPGAPARSA